MHMTKFLLLLAALIPFTVTHADPPFSNLGLKVQGGGTAVVSVSGGVGTNPYTAGKQMGSLITFSNILRKNNWTASLASVSIVDADKQKSAIDLYLFSAPPAYAGTDGVTFAPTAAEMRSKFIGVVHVLAGDYSDTSSNSVCIETSLGMPIYATDGTKNIYGYLVSQGTPTYSAATSIYLKLAAFED